MDSAETIGLATREMRALRWWGRGDVRVDAVPRPHSPPPGWVTVEIDACGICGTDVEEFTHGPIVSPIEPHPLTGCQVPVTMGHEAVGRIVESNDPAAAPVGTRVIVEGNRYCGRCYWCERGDYPLCEILGSLGQMGDGGLAEYMLAPGYMCLPVPSHLSAPEATLIEPLSVILRAFNRQMDVRGDSVVIFGAGTLGLLAVQVAAALGANDVVVVDPIRSRLGLAKQLGAHLTLTPDEAGALRERYPAHGPDWALECAGTVAAAQMAVAVVRKGGAAVLLGVNDGQISFNMLTLVLEEKRILTSVSHSWDEDVPAAIAMVARREVGLTPLITSVIPLSRTVEDGFGRLLRGSARDLKIVVVPDERLTDA